MNMYIEQCMLLDEQRSLILQGIREGKKEYQLIKDSMPELTTRKHDSGLLYDYVNTYIEKAIRANPHTKMKVYKKIAGFHPYIVIQDTIRNIFILVSKLSENKHIYNPSEYRGDFASSNFDRLLTMGFPEEKLFDENPYQLFFPLGVDNQPFGIIVSYDSISDVVYEGALKPNQEDWIYKEDITESTIFNKKDIMPLNNDYITDINTSLKARKEDTDIVIRLKNNTSS